MKKYSLRLLKADSARPSVRLSHSPAKPRMSVISETLALPVIGAPARKLPSALLVGVAASSCGALLLELALTRLFSVVLFYHFAFLAISIALLGLGSGGVFAYLRKHVAGPVSRPAPCLPRFALPMPLAVPAVLELCLHLGVSLELSRNNFARLTAIYLFSAVPFFHHRR